MSDHPSGSDQQPPSFAELAEREHISAVELMTCFHGYADQGLAIDARTVIGLAEGVSFSAPQYSALAEIASVGINAQLEGGRYSSSPETSKREAKEYMKILGYASLKIHQIAFNN